MADAAAAAGRPTPALSARVRVQLDPPAKPDATYALRGDPETMAVEIRAWAAIGVTHLALHFGTTDAVELVGRVERFDREVAPLV